MKLHRPPPTTNFIEADKSKTYKTGITYCQMPVFTFYSNAYFSILVKISKIFCVFNTYNLEHKVIIFFLWRTFILHPENSAQSQNKAQTSLKFLHWAPRTEAACLQMPLNRHNWSSKAGSHGL